MLIRDLCRRFAFPATIRWKLFTLSERYAFRLAQYRSARADRERKLGRVAFDVNEAAEQAKAATVDGTPLAQRSKGGLSTWSLSPYIPPSSSSTTPLTYVSHSATIQALLSPSSSHEFQNDTPSSTQSGSRGAAAGAPAAGRSFEPDQSTIASPPVTAVATNTTTTPAKASSVAKSRSTVSLHGRHRTLPSLSAYAPSPVRDQGAQADTTAFTAEHDQRWDIRAALIDSPQPESKSDGVTQSRSTIGAAPQSGSRGDATIAAAIEHAGQRLDTSIDELKRLREQLNATLQSKAPVFEESNADPQTMRPPITPKKAQLSPSARQQTPGAPVYMQGAAAGAVSALGYGATPEGGRSRAVAVAGRRATGVRGALLTQSQQQAFQQQQLQGDDDGDGRFHDDDMDAADAEPAAQIAGERVTEYEDEPYEDGVYAEQEVHDESATHMPAPGSRARAGYATQAMTIQHAVAMSSGARGMQDPGQQSMRPATPSGMHRVQNGARPPISAVPRAPVQKMDRDQQRGGSHQGPPVRRPRGVQGQLPLQHAPSQQSRGPVRAVPLRQEADAAQQQQLEYEQTEMVNEQDGDEQDHGHTTDTVADLRDVDREMMMTSHSADDLLRSYAQQFGSTSTTGPVSSVRTMRPVQRPHSASAAQLPQRSMQVHHIHSRDRYVFGSRTARETTAWMAKGFIDAQRSGATVVRTRDRSHARQLTAQRTQQPRSGAGSNKQRSFEDPTHEQARGRGRPTSAQSDSSRRRASSVGAQPAGARTNSSARTAHPVHSDRNHVQSGVERDGIAGDGSEIVSQEQHYVPAHVKSHMRAMKLQQEREALHREQSIPKEMRWAQQIGQDQIVKMYLRHLPKSPASSNTTRVQQRLHAEPAGVVEDDDHLQQDGDVDMYFDAMRASDRSQHSLNIAQPLLTAHMNIMIVPSFRPIELERDHICKYAWSSRFY